MNAKQLAEELQRQQYPLALSAERREKIKAAGLIVVMGHSDDVMLLLGAITDEFDCYDGGTALIDSKGLLPARENLEEDHELEEYFARKRIAVPLEALWCAEPEHCWTYKTEIPHETFELFDDEEPYCRGLVMDIQDLPF
ncbi:hypothetical protein HBA55_29810 [Pseudomaricurvus alkylphenolicus]|uniref:hypothetical protein n=1 Tax=Pseudomaricurvus alkylphenolicus TaxID=1306991 RepID=UPI001423AE28|nr:hypothetical protein [Pseudomaricurvus alkylphenolicus]NIB43836.1 hypothetical protein [Pseudomaricurvus alkylphenolicus]